MVIDDQVKGMWNLWEKLDPSLGPNLCNLKKVHSAHRESWREKSQNWILLASVWVWFISDSYAWYFLLYFPCPKSWPSVNALQWSCCMPKSCNEFSMASFALPQDGTLSYLKGSVVSEYFNKHRTLASAPFCWNPHWEKNKLFSKLAGILPMLFDWWKSSDINSATSSTFPYS